jgi:cold shock CspA family protein
MDLRQGQEFAKQKLYSKALTIFDPVYELYSYKFNKWDLYYYAKSLSKEQQESKAFLISKNLYKNDQNMVANKTLYMWLTYNLYVKTNLQSQGDQEQLLFRAANYIVENTRQEAFSPYEKTVFAVIKHLKKKANSDYKKILEWLSLLEISKLSNVPYKYVDSEGKNREEASPKEQWYAVKVKALYETKQYSLCIQVANEALNVIERFHYSNDIWIREKKAVSTAFLGETLEALEQLKQLVKEKPHSVIFYDIFKIQRSLGKFNEALSSGASGLLDKNGEFQHKLSLLIDMAVLLKESGNYDKAYAHLSLVKEVRNQNGWRPIPKLDAELSRLHQQITSQHSLSRKALVTFWKQLMLNSLPKGKGTIKTLLPHGKAGFIQTEGGQDIYFRMSNVISNRNKLKKLTSVKFYKKESFDQARNRDSIEAIEVTILE